MTSNRKNFAILFGVLVPTGLAAGAVLAVAGATDDNLVLLLALTARVAFMIFLLIFVARPLRELVRTEATRWLMRERRSLGIAFAAVMAVHLALIGWRFETIPGLTYPPASATIGGMTYALIFLMLATSFDRPARMLGPSNWRRLHKFGLYFVGAIFLFTLLPEPDQPMLSVERLWFVILTSLAIVIRLTAWLARRSGVLRPRG